MRGPLASYSDQALIDELMARRRLEMIRAQRLMSADVLFKHREPMMLSMADQLSHEIGQFLLSRRITRVTVHPVDRPMTPEVWRMNLTVLKEAS